MGRFTTAIRDYWKPAQPSVVGGVYHYPYGSGQNMFDKRFSNATTINSRSSSFTHEELEHLNSKLDGFSSSGRYSRVAFMG